MGAKKAEANAIGKDLLAVLPDDNTPWYKKGHLLRLNFSIFSLVLFSSANGYDGSLMNGLLALPQWNAFMNDPSPEWLGFMNAIYWIANGCCYPLSAWIANKYGRKTGIYIGYVLITAGVCCSAGPTGSYFVASRAIIGAASCWFSGIVAMLITETAYPTHRSIATALYNTGWYVGGTIGAFVTFGTRNYQSDWSWRIPTILQLLIPLCALPGFLLAPESPRYLVSVDRHEAAREMLMRHHDGYNNPELINYELLEITATLQAEKDSKQAASYADLFRTKGNRHRLAITVTLAFFAQWVGNGVVSYYLPLVLEAVNVTSVRDQTLISGCLQVWNLFWAVGAAALVDKLGRRLLFLTSAVTMLISYIIVTGLSGSFASTENSATGLAVIPFLFIFFAGYDIALTPLNISYTCEIWPYRLRSRGVTVNGMTTVVAIVFNIFVNPIALEAIAWRYYFVFVAVLVAYLLTTYFFYPETRGHSLEQMAVVFDGDAAAVPDSKEVVERSKSVTSEKNGVTFRHEEAV